MTDAQSTRLSEITAAARAQGHRIETVEEFGGSQYGYSGSVGNVDVVVRSSDGRAATFSIKPSGRYSRTAHMKMNPSRRKTKKAGRSVFAKSGFGAEQERAIDRELKRRKSTSAGKRSKSRQTHGGAPAKKDWYEPNPLPVGRFVTVRAIRRKNGHVDIYEA
jgi:hypothetical protein